MELLTQSFLPSTDNMWILHLTVAIIEENLAWTPEKKNYMLSWIFTLKQYKDTDSKKSETRWENTNLTSTFEVAPQRCDQFQVSMQKCQPALPYARLVAVFLILLPAVLTNAHMWPVWTAVFQYHESWPHVCEWQSVPWRSDRSSTTTRPPDCYPSWMPQRQQMTVEKKKCDWTFFLFITPVIITTP